MTETIITATNNTYNSINGQNATYSTARSTYTSYSANLWVGQLTTYICTRGFLKFDTSVIPASDVVTDVKIRMVVTTDNSAADFDIQICEQDWSALDPFSGAGYETAYDNCLAEADYFLWKNTSGISINTQYTSASLTNSYVNRGGNTYYSVRSKKDYDNSAPTSGEHVYFGLPNNATEAYRPVLIVTHSTAFVPRVIIL